MLKNVSLVEKTYYLYGKEIIQAFRELYGKPSVDYITKEGNLFKVHPNQVEISEMPKRDVSLIEEKLKELTRDCEVQLVDYSKITEKNLLFCQVNIRP